MTTLGNAVPEVPIVPKLLFENDGRRVPASVISVPCPVCRSEKRVEVFPGTIPPEQLQTSAKYSYDVLLDGHHPIVRCIDCGLYYTCPRDSQETLERVYASGNVESY